MSVNIGVVELSVIAWWHRQHLSTLWRNEDTINVDRKTERDREMNVINYLDAFCSPSAAITLARASRAASASAAIALNHRRIQSELTRETSLFSIPLKLNGQTNIFSIRKKALRIKCFKEMIEFRFSIMKKKIMFPYTSTRSTRTPQHSVPSSKAAWNGAKERVREFVYSAQKKTVEFWPALFELLIRDQKGFLVETSYPIWIGINRSTNKRGIVDSTKRKTIEKTNTFRRLVAASNCVLFGASSTLVIDVTGSKTRK